MVALDRPRPRAYWLVVIASIVAGACSSATPSGSAGPMAATTSLSPSPSSSVASGSPETSPVATSALPSSISLALDATFTSSGYGYSVAYPKGWKTTQATYAWELADQETPYLNEWYDNLEAQDARFSGASVKLCDGETDEEWLDYFALPDTWHGWGPIDIGGHEGLLDYDGTQSFFGSGGSGSGNKEAAVVVLDHHGYSFYMFGKTDLATFKEFLATVRFDTAKAHGAFCFHYEPNSEWYGTGPEWPTPPS